MDHIKLSNLLFPNIENNITDYYAPRESENIITRVAPSPTGFIHLGNLYSVLINERFAHSNNGIFYLRIEDTDQKRKIEYGIDSILNLFKDFKINFDEGPLINTKYGPYIQSERKEIYLKFIKYLISINKAYPCFCSEKTINEIKSYQKQHKNHIGYYDKYALCRNLTFDEILEKINMKMSYVIRLKSNGNPSNKVQFTDLNKGNLSLDENFNDIIILKSDFMPTYHFAHVIDDYLMGTTHVIRGEEWLATLPVHIQLFNYLNFKLPKYLHTSHLLKLDNNIKRKLSKRKDPELSLEYYEKLGYPNIVLIEYLMGILNSNFESWRKENRYSDYKEFNFNIKKLPKTGSLFDIKKLNDISKNFISNLSVENLYEYIIFWCKKYNKKLYLLFIKNKDYIFKILSISQKTKNPRKDIINFSQIENYLNYFYDELFVPNEQLLRLNILKYNNNINEILEVYKKIYSLNDTEEQWYIKIKQLCLKFNIAENKKIFELNKDKYIFDINHLIKIFRIIFTGKESSPGLSIIMNILGNEKINNRLKWGQFICMKTII